MEIIKNILSQTIIYQIMFIVIIIMGIIINYLWIKLLEARKDIDNMKRTGYPNNLDNNHQIKPKRVTTDITPTSKSKPEADGKFSSLNVVAIKGYSFDSMKNTATPETINLNLPTIRSLS